MVQWGKATSKEEKLHEVWDSLIIKKLRGYKQPRDADPHDVYDKGLSLAWASDLKTRLDAKMFNLAAECVDISTAQTCALKWAGEANKFVCSYVLKDGKNLGPDEGEEDCQWEWHGPADVSKEYYVGAVPIVEGQVAKAGWRLGQWINALAKQRASMRKNGVVFEDTMLEVQPQLEL
jgi:S1/P1 Nuclease